MNEMEKPYFEWVDFTPEMAQKALAQFAPNRTSSNAKVTQYARAMKAGLWLMAGDPVRVTADGTYIDGEHRFRAIVAADMTVCLSVMRNAPREAMKVIDTGRSRQYKDFLQIEGTEHARDLAPLVRRMFLWDAGIYFASGAGKITPSSVELDAYLAAHPELHSVAAAVDAGRPPMVGPTAFGTCLALFSRIDGATAGAFCTDWLTGVDLSVGSPVLALRERIQRESGSYGKNTATEYKIALACVAWNCFRRGTPVSKLQLPKDFSNANYPMPR